MWWTEAPCAQRVRATSTSWTLVISTPSPTPAVPARTRRKQLSPQLEPVTRETDRQIRARLLLRLTDLCMLTLHSKCVLHSPIRQPIHSFDLFSRTLYLQTCIKPSERLAVEKEVDCEEIRIHNMLQDHSRHLDSRCLDNWDREAGYKENEGQKLSKHRRWYSLYLSFIIYRNSRIKIPFGR